MADEQQRAFTDLYEAASADVWRFVRRRVATSADADDVTADVFAVAWRRADSLPPTDERRLWLFGVARNVLRNHDRSQSRRRRLASALTSVARLNGHAGGAPSGERDSTLWTAMGRLREADRDVLLLQVWDELSVKEIAAMLAVSPNAVSVRLSRARAELRRHLGEKDQRTRGDETYDPGTAGSS